MLDDCVRQVFGDLIVVVIRRYRPDFGDGGSDNEFRNFYGVQIEIDRKDGKSAVSVRNTLALNIFSITSVNVYLFNLFYVYTFVNVQNKILQTASIREVLSTHKKIKITQMQRCQPNNRD